VKLTPIDAGETLVRVNARLGYRPPGAHVSEIIRDIEDTVNKPGQRPPSERLSSEERRRMGNYVALGWAWELIIQPALMEVYFGADENYVRPGPLQLDGIWGTPDGLDMETWAVEEFKCTWRSSGRDIQEDFWPWWVQIKAYCKMLVTRKARLRVFFVNGDYHESGPQIKMWEAEFKQLEIEQNWQMLKQHARAKGMI
jgi:hypothetical protein